MKKAFVFLIVTLSTVVMSVNAQTTVNKSLIYGGITRTYSLYVPASYASSQAVPLLLNLHGYTSNGAQQAIYGDFRPIADTAKFIVVHPNGTVDPIGGQTFWNFGIVGATVDDYGFLEAMIDAISEEYSINQNRIYSVGMSNGGFMSYGLACQSNRFAAVGSVTGSMSLPMYNSCSPARPTPVIHIHGTVDATVPYNGSASAKAAEDVVAYWVTNNNCNQTPQTTNIPNSNLTDGATAERLLYSGGTNGHTVEFFKVINGGHTWPGSNIPLQASGNTCLDFSASKEIWRFFSQYEIQNTASLENLKINDLVNIYPNPTTDEINFSVQTNVKILNITGQIVANQNQITTLDMNAYPAGIYIAILTDEKGEAFQRSKIVKK
jgi:polyhydroxybutyrate depolymerase